MSKRGKRCSACGNYHYDHSAIHFSWIEDELGGLCLPDHLDHYPEEGDLLVTNDIRKVTCEACKKHYRTLNDLCKAMSPVRDHPGQPIEQGGGEDKPTCRRCQKVMRIGMF